MPDKTISPPIVPAWSCQSQILEILSHFEAVECARSAGDCSGPCVYILPREKSTIVTSELAAMRLSSGFSNLERHQLVSTTTRSGFNGMTA